MRTDPPWSPPTAMSTSAAATRAAAQPLDEPPDVRVGSQGLRTGPLSEVWLAPEKQRLSQTALPTTVAPASSSRVTTVASYDGTNPSTVREPFIIGTPATEMLSLIATRTASSAPPEVPMISVRAYHAPSGLSASSTRLLLRASGTAGAYAQTLLDQVVGRHRALDETEVGIKVVVGETDRELRSRGHQVVTARGREGHRDTSSSRGVRDWTRANLVYRAGRVNATAPVEIVAESLCSRL